MFSMNRWVLRRQRKLLCVGVALLLIMVVYISLVFEDIKIEEKHYQPFSEVCLTGKGEKLLSSLCRNHTNGIAYGNLCYDICTRKLFKLYACIHHGTTYVLLGKLNSYNVALKLKEVQNLIGLKSAFERYVDHFTNELTSVRDFFVERLSEEIRASSGEKTFAAFHRNSANIFRKLFNTDKERITLKQMRNSWWLIGQDEVLLYAIHENMNSFTKLIGTCGPVYALEEVRPFSDYFPELLQSMEWQKRVAIAISFLNMVSELEHSAAGALHHCDIQESNFGITKDLRVKAIDIDLIYAGDRISEILGQPKCNKDADCNFFDCQSKCDIETKKCGNSSITNNLQVICRDIFQPTWPLKGLLSSSVPKHVSKRLESLLADCKSPEFGFFPVYHATVKGMLTELRNTLKLSLQQTVTY